MSKIEMCTDHTGKMEGINSISTSTLLNENCRKNAAIKSSICSHCYAENMCEMYKGLRERLERNTRTLTERIIPMEELPDTTGMEIFRFESFGDLNNATQLENYLNIARKNPGTRFTLWTKMYKLVYEYFKDHEVPENFTLILSSLFVNMRMPLTQMKSLGKFAPGQLKVFTVYNKEYIKEHMDDLDLNCGSRYCNGCRKCYSKNTIEEINEILKSDQDQVGIMKGLADPELTKRMVDIISSFDDFAL